MRLHFIDTLKNAYCKEKLIYIKKDLFMLYIVIGFLDRFMVTSIRRGTCCEHNWFRKRKERDAPVHSSNKRVATT